MGPLALTPPPTATKCEPSAEDARPDQTKLVGLVVLDQVWPGARDGKARATQDRIMNAERIGWLGIVLMALSSGLYNFTVSVKGMWVSRTLLKCAESSTEK